MDEKTLLGLKIKGFVTVDDVTGKDDAEKLQAAIKLAVEEEIRKVVVDKDLTIEKTVTLPAGIEVKFAEGVKVSCDARLLFVNEVSTMPEKASWSFEDKWIYLIGEKDAVIEGGIRFYHAGNLVLEDLTVDGNVSFEFCREIRMERNIIRSAEGPALTLMRGCNNYIVQYNTFEAPETVVAVDAALEEGGYVIGKDTDIHEIIVRDNTMSGETAMFIGASEESGVFNVQYDGTKTGGTAAVIGREGETLDKKRYFNITSTDHNCKKDRILYNDVKHCYFGE